MNWGKKEPVENIFHLQPPPKNKTEYPKAQNAVMNRPNKHELGRRKQQQLTETT